ncbi:hypothetical protein [Actinopolymorpha alba]|uniref:hypothetical protein n=1 Tax=Actinopolymorpha alba TaxID=533267 RepID=UPI0003827251|nr:hypothetical protein [Actinopolymorpha alba]
MKILKSFGWFWYDFLIGDDWKIAAGVVSALVALVVVVKLDVLGDTGLVIVGAVAIVLAFAFSLMIDVRQKSAVRPKSQE